MKKLIFIFVFIFLIGSVSAFEFDNIKSYNEDTRVLTIKNAFGLGDDILTARLVTPHINKISIGGKDTLVAEIDLSFFDEDTTNFFQSYKLYDVKNNFEEIEREITFKYGIDGKANECNVINVEDCNLIIKTNWIKFTSVKEIPRGITKIGLFADTFANERIEWIPKIRGVEVEEWALWDIDTATYDNVFIASQNSAPQGLFWKDDGTKMYESGTTTNDRMYESACSDAWNLSSCSLTDFIASQDTTQRGMFFSTNGSNLYEVGSGAGGDVYQYNCATAWDLSTCSFISSNATTVDASPFGVVFSENGSNMYIAGVATDKHYQYTCTSPWLLSSCTYDDVSNISSQVLDPADLKWKTDGTRFFGLTDSTFEGVFQYECSTPWRITSCTYDGVSNLSVSGQDATPASMFFRPDGSNFYMIGNGNDEIYQYSIADIVAVTLNSPVDAFNSSVLLIDFNGTVSSPITLVNVTLFIDGILNETNSSGINNVDYLFTKTILEGNHNWTYEACDTNECITATTRTFTIDISTPALNVTEPFGVVPFQDISINQTIRWNVSDINIDTCTLEYESVNQTVNCAVNISNFTIGTARTLTLYANDTFGNLNSSTVTWSYLSLQTSSTFNASSFETATETFTVNVTTNGSVVTAGTLTFDGTENTGATITNPATNNYTITKIIDIPLGTGTANWTFNLTVGGHLVNTTIQNQIINVTTFEDCNLALSYINITFKNETVAEETVSAEIDSDWNFWLGSGTVIKTFSFANTTENFDYPFCLTSGGNRTLNANVSLTYDNSISELRSFSNTYSLTNDPTNQTLFLLPTTDGVFVTFQTVTAAEQVISGVDANVTKAGDIIASGVTDDAGLIQYFLDPDTTYVFSFSKTGFDVVTTTLKPTQSSFTIIMGGVIAPPENDTTKGISYIINPLANILNNNTETEFNLTFSSIFWLLDSFGFALKNSTGDVFNLTTSTTNTGGFLSQTLNTGNNTDLIMEVFWTINGTQTNVTRTWIVIDTSDEGFSIKTFFDDLSTYLTSGLFGLTSFGLGIIIFMIILITTGVLSMKLGIVNPAGLSIIVFAMVLFFDVGLGIMPNPIGAVPNFPSIFIGVIFLGLLLKEAVIR
ncbi:hypothetical protein LCGC14_1060620 [marine sediment metagenome]|uniref:Uncharacterized protein n=1 Tax=marine sediment metagenome TaxID=412755 RepID=A0A0F9QS37_9ZZZZ